MQLVALYHKTNCVEPAQEDEEDLLWKKTCLDLSFSIFYNDIHAFSSFIFGLRENNKNYWKIMVLISHLVWNLPTSTKTPPQYTYVRSPTDAMFALRDQNLYSMIFMFIV